MTAAVLLLCVIALIQARINFLIRGRLKALEAQRGL